MSRKSRARLISSAALVAASLLPLWGCSDYLNHHDRVTLAGGNAVRANLERETINPAKASMYRTKGLGRDGGQIPDESPAETASTP